MQNPNFKNQRKTFSFGKKKPGRADEGGLTRALAHNVLEVPSSLEARGKLFMQDKFLKGKNTFRWDEAKALVL